MSLVKFVKRLLAWAVGSPAPPATPIAAPALPPSEEVTPRPSASVMLRREEMLDQRGRLAGYRFSFKTAPGALATPPDVYLEALQSANVKSLAERRLAMVALQLEEWQAEDFRVLNAAHTVFHVQLPQQALMSDVWLAGLQHIRDSGAGVAISCAEDWPQLAPALALATHGVVDFASVSIERFEQLVKGLRQGHPNLVLTVDKVSSWPERRLCMALGIQFAMGTFLATADERDKGQKLTEGRLVLMEMLNLVRNDGDAHALASVAKRDPGVAVHLLSMANSPAYGLSTPVTGIDQAIAIMGRERLYRWLAISVFRAGADSACDAALLEVALARARFLELAALSVGSKQQADELFLVGLLSFVDTLLGMPIQEVATSISLPPVVCDVLLHSQGPYARYLILALSVEKCLAARAGQLASALGIKVDELTIHRNAALLWAEEAVG